MTETENGMIESRNQRPEVEDRIADLTPIQSFYKDAKIFITGGTGFLGRILIEKLLRSCPDLSVIYILIRTKKGKNMETRLVEMFDDVVFERLKKEQPNFMQKVVGIAGNCMSKDLGLSMNDRRALIEKVNILFHVAATVRFDEKLKTAVAINIRSSRDISAMARQMHNLKSFVHVSSAYANSPNKFIEEKIYPPAIDPTLLIDIAEHLGDDILADITPRLVGEYPNTYAFTKQVAEYTVKQIGADLPLGIFRPAAVTSTYREPIKGWINNYYGPSGITAGVGLGLLRILRCDETVDANIVPVDMCVNSLIASAWEVKETFEESKKTGDEYDIPIYNYVSSIENRLTWSDYETFVEKYGAHYPPLQAIWIHNYRNTKGYWTNMAGRIILHTIPAIIGDTILRCIGRKPMLMAAYDKIHKFSNVISYFCTQSWEFKGKNVESLCQKLSARDKKMFFSDIKELEWDEYFKEYTLGLRTYLLGEPPSNLTEARIRYRKLYWAHQTLKIFLTLLFLGTVIFVINIFS